MSEMMQQQPVNSNPIAEALELEKKKREKERREQKFEAGLNQLVEKVIEEELKAQQNQGEQTIMGEVLMTFLDVALEMKEMMNTLKAINVAMECLGDAIGFLDQALEFDNQMLSDSLQVKYGFFQRMKQKSQQKKAMKNNMRRMESVIQSITMKYQMATSMMDMFGSMNVKLHKMMNLRMEKRKKVKKSAPTGGIATSDSPARRMIAQAMADRGLGTVSAPTQPTMGGNAGSSDNSDILD
ncbi:MAG: hypothetical protein J6S04_06160 [Clostridia bacterium]|nr:hypothetical protein [Clostridia bacterium]